LLPGFLPAYALLAIYTLLIFKRFWASPKILFHGHFPYGSHACLYEELSEQSIRLIRVVRNEEPGSLEVVRVHLERFDELVKVDLLAGLGRGLRRGSCVESRQIYDIS
jgi:hypothetical protein